MQHTYTPPDQIATDKISSIASEQGVLGACLLNNDFLDSVKLEADDFYEALHGRIYQLMQDRRKRGRTSDPVSLKHDVEDYEAIPAVTGELSIPQYLGRLAAHAPIPNSVPEYARNIRDMTARRKMLEALQEATGKALAGRDVLEMASDVISSMDEVVTSRRANRRESQTVAYAAVAAVDQALKFRDKPPISTGFRPLDVRLGGLHRGEYTILAGRPSMGKSALAVAMGLASATAGQGVIYFSLEMTAEALASRCLTDRLYDGYGDPYHYAELRRGNIDQEQATRLLKTAGELKNIPLQIVDIARPSLGQIGAMVRRQAAIWEDKGISLDTVIIDLMGKVRPPAAYAGSRYNEMTEISGAMPELAKQNNCHVIGLHQLSRQVEQRDNKRPMLSDLRDSGSLEQDADNVLFAYRPEYYLQKALAKAEKLEDQTAIQAKLDERQNIIEIIIDKQRAGETGIVELYANMGANAFRELDKQHGRMCA